VIKTATLFSLSVLLAACAGAEGPPGPQGERGEQGDEGKQGETGAQGPQGEQGETGPQGDKGDPGVKGDTGDSGAQGPKGDKGDTGDAGPQGEQGPKGETGDAASSIGTVEGSLYCGGLLEGTTINFSYQAVVFTDGTIWVNGEIRGVDLGISSSAFYAPTQNGAVTAQVIISLDMVGTDNGGWWTIEVNREDLGAIVIYHDTELTDGTDAWNMDAEASGCIHNQY
jgi:Collagen triple helix repeat (20 copies)